MSVINGTPVGSYSHLGKTFTLVDENGTEITGVVVDQEVVFDATTNDVREGKVYAGDEGVKTGTKNIPSYRTCQGASMVSAGEEFEILSLKNYNGYDYTQLQCIIAPFNTIPADSVAADKIVLNSNVYQTNSSTILSTVSKDSTNKSIKLNITNNTGQDYIIHYFTYREED